MGTNFQEIDAKEAKINEELQQKKVSDLSGYTYCMVSTFNQMVNYLPMLLFPHMKNRLYITIADGKAGDKNKAFDEALSKTCINNGINFPAESEWLKLGSPYSTQAIKSDIESSINAHKEKKIFWNITGGQRPIMMAILDLAQNRKDDYVCYLEGNEGKLIIQKSDGLGSLSKIDLSQDQSNKYAIAEGTKGKLTIPIALQLMGFTDKVKVAKQEKGQEGEVDYNNFLALEKPDSSAYISLIGKYRTIKILPKKLLGLNKQSDNEDDGCIYFAKNNIKEYPQYFDELDSAELKIILVHESRPYPFGHILEELFAYAIWEVAKNHIVDMGINIRLRFNNETVDNRVVDELDIAVLTKTGQLVVFEVKSGDMHSDVAKSTKYTTYAIAGVYGKPVLLTALLKNQLTDLQKTEKGGIYEASASAARAADRAQLPIIALDGDNQNDFETAIKNLLNINS